MIYGKRMPGPYEVNAFGGDYEVIAHLVPSGVAICVNSPCKDADPIATAKLFAAAPTLLALAHRYASECAECNGTGLVTIRNYDGHGSDADDQPCPDCADIREVIAKVVA